MGVEIGFVILDEVFGSQDSECRRRLIYELRTLGNRFHQLFVITDVPDVADPASTKSKPSSRSRVAASWNWVAG